MVLLPVATKAPIFAVELHYHTYKKRYVLGAQQSISINGAFFTPLIGSDIEFGSYSIGFNERPFSLILPLSDSFADQASSGFPFSPIEVTVFEVLQSFVSPAEDVSTVFRGRVVEAIRNYRGRQGIVGLRCVSCKAELGVPMGIPVNPQCPWVFASPACGVIASSDSAQVVNLVGRNLTVTWLSGPSTEPEFYFRGYVEYESLRISIRGWDVNSNTEILLTKEAPPTWAGQVVSVFPGCDKTISVCRDRWNNEARFGGSGIKMPSYKPTSESPI